MFRGYVSGTCFGGMFRGMFRGCANRVPFLNLSRPKMNKPTYQIIRSWYARICKRVSSYKPCIILAWSPPKPYISQALVPKSQAWQLADDGPLSLLAESEQDLEVRPGDGRGAYEGPWSLKRDWGGGGGVKILRGLRDFGTWDQGLSVQVSECIIIFRQLRQEHKKQEPTNPLKSLCRLP